jgi:hypothetical protein
LLPPATPAPAGHLGTIETSERVKSHANTALDNLSHE